MREGFVSLAALLRGDDAVGDAPPAPLAPSPVAAARPAACAHAETISQLARMHLAAIEAFEAGSAIVLEALAREVLARELALAPADVRALAERALATFRDHAPVALVVAPADADAVTGSLPVRVDRTLEPGDLIVEVANGAFESPLAFRFAAALRS